jgi:metallo-beta-lactamase family protein
MRIAVALQSVLGAEMKLTFYGGAGTVSGANYMLEAKGRARDAAPGIKILVDCGLYQGSNFAERKNFEPFPYDPKEIKAVFITHSHIDHIGLLPKLWKDGFRGKIYSTPPCRDFSELLLIDSEGLLRKEAEREGKPPLYTVSDIDEVMKLWQGIPYHKPVKVGNLEVTLWNAGHILGSAIIRIKAEGRVILFSGDLGNYPAPIIRDTETLRSADYAVVESTYGGRVHEGEDKRQELLEDVIEDTVRAGGTLMIPAFAMERTQDLLLHLNNLVEKGRVPRVPVFIDSPLAINLTAIYKKYKDYFDEETLAQAYAGDDLFNFPGLRLTLTAEESKAINEVPPPKVIIAGSGMSNGGRILHHERRYLSDPKSTILFVGYQSPGTLGRQILDGARSVKIFGEEVPIRCRVRQISGYSAHADEPRLLNWLRPLRFTLQEVFVVQGEPEASQALAQRIRDELALRVIIPQAGESYVLE